MGKIYTANANPAKQFFVNMITRDISFGDTILDLIDNSVDSALRLLGNPLVGLLDGPDLSPYSIRIVATPEEFNISDTCGGMTLAEATETAFNFGRKGEVRSDPYSVGVYGIGMKRAAFKLGRTVRIKSTCHASDDNPESFVVPINVADWLEDLNWPWQFPIRDAEELENPGVEIVVSDLTEGAKRAFSNPIFFENLRRTISRDYALHLNKGLKLTVNGNLVKGQKSRIQAR